MFVIDLPLVVDTPAPNAAVSALTQFSFGGTNYRENAQTGTNGTRFCVDCP